MLLNTTLDSYIMYNEISIRYPIPIPTEHEPTSTTRSQPGKGGLFVVLKSKFLAKIKILYSDPRSPVRILTFITLFQSHYPKADRTGIETNGSEGPTGAEGRNTMPRNRTPLTGQQEMFIRMSAQAKSREEILKAVFDLDLNTDDLKTIHNADCKMSRWRKLPEFESIWKDEVKQILYGCTAEAVQVIKGQLRSDMGWLQNKAANDLLNYGKQQIYGDEERTVHVQIEGLPEIGSPEEEE